MTDVRITTFEDSEAAVSGNGVTVTIAEGGTGTVGPQGPQGPQGEAGGAGPAGAQGPKGDPGDAGATGAPGPTGPAGADGAPGATGPAGPKGDPGDVGPAGPQGLTGPAGPQGDTGDVGPAGPQGLQGATGPQGIKGDTGATGATGPAGPKGDTGNTGATGPAGPGVPAGGTTGQVLAKTSNADYATGWTTPSAGGSSGLMKGMWLAPHDRASSPYLNVVAVQAWRDDLIGATDPTYRMIVKLGNVLQPGTVVSVAWITRDPAAPPGVSTSYGMFGQSTTQATAVGTDTSFDQYPAHPTAGTTELRFRRQRYAGGQGGTPAEWVVGAQVWIEAAEMSPRNIDGQPPLGNGVGHTARSHWYFGEKATDDGSTATIYDEPAGDLSGVPVAAVTYNKGEYVIHEGRLFKSTVDANTTKPGIASLPQGSASGTTLPPTWAEVPLLRPRQRINGQTGTAYTLSLADAGGLVMLTNAAATTLTIPTHASVRLPVGTRIEGIQNGAGQVTIAGAAGVTVNSPSGLKVSARYGRFDLTKVDDNTWLASGSLTP